ncbi:atherin-like [Theropithecus gelada]|uniref:atherin-like n=1 Tax=Theropithecus gelada TaxID=9565 RepID=UPI000DC1A86A|nr:atherin-like [Theropithecus gelada]
MPMGAAPPWRHAASYSLSRRPRRALASLWGLARAPRRPLATLTPPGRFAGNREAGEPSNRRRPRRRVQRARAASPGTASWPLGREGRAAGARRRAAPPPGGRRTEPQPAQVSTGHSPAGGEDEVPAPSANPARHGPLHRPGRPASPAPPQPRAPQTARPTRGVAVRGSGQRPTAGSTTVPTSRAWQGRRKRCPGKAAWVRKASGTGPGTE